MDVEEPLGWSRRYGGLQKRQRGPRQTRVPGQAKPLSGTRRTEKRGRKTVVEWGVAAKIALGGLGMVVIILLILCLTVWMAKSIVEKIEGGEKEK